MCLLRFKLAFLLESALLIMADVSTFLQIFVPLN